MTKTQERRIGRRNQLAQQHFDLVREIAQRLARRLPPVYDEDELVGPGYEGLLQAAERYRPRTHVPFVTWARRRIRGAIIDYVRQKYSERVADSPGSDQISTGPAAVETIEQGERRRIVAMAVERLPAAERILIHAHYGPSEVSLDVIARMLHITPRRTSELHRRALGRLREDWCLRAAA